MKTILNLRRHHYVAGASIFLITVALIAGMAGCGGGPVEYDLTITSTAGGSVTTPGEAGPYTYDEGTVVNLVATPDAGYLFVNWTGDVGTIAYLNGATTTISMQGDYSIMANFEVSLLQYDLTIASTAGGSVTTPGEGTSTYDAGTVVDLVATKDAGYRFASWTGDVGTIADANGATTITMQDDYSITANFDVLPEGHSDGDGLSDTEESQLGTDPNDDHDPGIYCLYNGLYMTKDYFCWQNVGGIDIALDSLVVRRGTNAIIGGAPDASITIAKSNPALTGLTAAGTGSRSISISDQNTVGHYTITLTEGAWSKSMEMYVIFELPQTTTDDGADCDGDPPDVYDDDDDIYELTDAGLKAYLYDEDGQKDDISVMWFASSDASIGKWSDFWYNYGHPCKGNGYFWHSLYCAGRFDNKQYTKKVLVDHVMQAINGETNQWDAAIAIQNYMAPLKTFTIPNPYFDMFGGVYSDWLDGTSIYGNPESECSAFAAATCSFLRSAGIPARPVVVDHHAPPPAMNFDHATELWVSDPGNLGEQWYVMLGRSAGAGIEARPEPPGWPVSAGNRLMVTAGPDFVIADLDKAKGVGGSMIWLTNPAEGGDSVSAGWWDYHHWYGSEYNGADPGSMARKFWVLTENKVYWGITDPTTVPGCIWSAEPT